MVIAPCWSNQRRRRWQSPAPGEAGCGAAGAAAHGGAGGDASRGCADAAAAALPPAGLLCSGAAAGDQPAGTGASPAQTEGQQSPCAQAPAATAGAAPCRCRCPGAAAQDLAEKIAGNFARRTVHPKEDLLQLAMIGLIKAARRYDPSRGPFRPYGRTYANGEITHFLRDSGFLLKVPPTWRELHARGQRLLTSGVGMAEMLKRLGMTWISGCRSQKPAR